MFDVSAGIGLIAFSAITKSYTRSHTTEVNYEMS